MPDARVSKFFSRARIRSLRDALGRPAVDHADVVDEPLRVVIAGGGVAALEAALAIRDLAGSRVTLQIIAPDAAFTYRPLEVREPFAGGRAPRYDLAEFAASIDAELITDVLQRVAPAARRVFVEHGRALTYDALVLCLGTHPVSAHEHARLLAPGKLDDVLHGFVQDIEGGYIKSAAFLVPERVGWPLPMYELLLMTAERAASSMVDVDLTLVTSEPAPLAVFGEEASAAVLGRLAAAGVTVYTAAHAETPGNKLVIVTTDGVRHRLEVDSIIGLPELDGPAVDGLPHDDHGFLPVDELGNVVGADRVFAAGDATDGPIKQGGVAAQQAEMVAHGVAALAGARVDVRPFAPELRGVLLTGAAPLILGRPIEAPQGSVAGAPPLGKVAAPRLAAYLAIHEPLAATAIGAAATVAATD